MPAAARRFATAWTLLLVSLPLLCACDAGGRAAPASAWTVDAGGLKFAAPPDETWRLRLADGRGELLLQESASTASGPVGALGLHLGPPPEGAGQLPLLSPLVAGEPAAPPARNSGWVRATRVLDARLDDGVWTATLATTAPAYTIRLRLWREADGILGLEAVPQPDSGVQAIGIAFDSPPDERLVGFGERGNAVDQAGRTVEHYVGEGPYQDEEYGPITAVVPKWGIRWRQDASYFPMPWLLSSRGYGVLLDEDALSYHRLRSDDPGAWSVEVEDSRMRLRFFAGPQPADALRRFSAAIGRQPDHIAPWFLGPWLQADSDARFDELAAADVPSSVAATYLHYLPCGDHQGIEAAQLERVAGLNARGLAVHTYFNPMICESFSSAYVAAEAAGALIQDRLDRTYTYPYTTSSVFNVSQFDFSTPAGSSSLRTLTDLALSHGYEGWMEDFGEYTPLDAVARGDGATGTRFHNRYPRSYHCGVQAATAHVGKPLARFVRSGWTGSAACSPLVWGGDPTTSFGFDGLESSIYQALSMGTSGVGLWGSDIGGFFALGFNALSAELLDRWIAFGALSVIMRSQKDGIAVPDKSRPQPWDPEHLPIWRKFAKLHTQLYPYLRAAVDQYYASGLPVMRHHLLSHPQDPAASARDDQYMFGDDLLVAPVYTAGATERRLYLPAGDWLNFWEAVRYEEASGAFEPVPDAPLIAGGREISVAAPRDQIPLFVRAGARLPLLPADVDTLADHGRDDPAIVHLADRAGQIRELRFPTR